MLLLIFDWLVIVYLSEAFAYDMKQTAWTAVGEVTLYRGVASSRKLCETRAFKKNRTTVGVWPRMSSIRNRRDGRDVYTAANTAEAEKADTQQGGKIDMKVCSSFPYVKIAR